MGIAALSFASTVGLMKLCERLVHDTFGSTR
jgi:hypothetical protein